MGRILEVEMGCGRLVGRGLSGGRKSGLKVGEVRGRFVVPVVGVFMSVLTSLVTDLYS